MRKMFAGLLLGITAVFGMDAPLAHADGPDVGSPCSQSWNNVVMLTRDGSNKVRCMFSGPGADAPGSGWTWVPDTGTGDLTDPSHYPDGRYSPAPPAAPTGPCYYSPAHPECPPQGLTPGQRENW